MFSLYIAFEKFSSIRINLVYLGCIYNIKIIDLKLMRL